eukprot:COSAG02_NODE_47692_length_339_cov_0.858333_1_plen_33_part_10
MCIIETNFYERTFNVLSRLWETEPEDLRPLRLR